MKIACPHCRAAFALDDKRVPAAGLSIKCPKCKQPFAVHRAQPGDEGKLIEGTPLAVPLPAGRQARAEPPPPAPPPEDQAPPEGDSGERDDDTSIDQVVPPSLRAGAVPLPGSSEGRAPAGFAPPEDSPYAPPPAPTRSAPPSIRHARGAEDAVPLPGGASGARARSEDGGGVALDYPAASSDGATSSRSGRPAAKAPADDPFANIDIEVPDPSAPTNGHATRPPSGFEAPPPSVANPADPNEDPFGLDIPTVKPAIPAPEQAGLDYDFVAAGKPAPQAAAKSGPAAPGLLDFVDEGKPSTKVSPRTGRPPPVMAPSAEPSFISPAADFAAEAAAANSGPTSFGAAPQGVAAIDPSAGEAAEKSAKPKKEKKEKKEKEPKGPSVPLGERLRAMMIPLRERIGPAGKALVNVREKPLVMVGAVLVVAVLVVIALGVRAQSTSSGLFWKNLWTTSGKQTSAAAHEALGVGEMQLAAGTFGAAREALGTAARTLQALPDDDSARAFFVTCAAELRIGWGAGGGDWDQAQHVVEKLKSKQLDALRALGAYAVATGDLGAARSTLAPLGDTPDADPESVWLYAQALIRSNELAHAAQVLDNVIKGRPAVKLLLLRGLVERQRGKLEEAGKFFEQVLAKSPELGRAMVELADVKLQTHDLAGAKLLLDRALQDNVRHNLDASEEGRAAMLRARLFAEQHQGKEAEAEFERAAALDPNSAPIHAAYGMFRVNRRENDKAAKQFDMALAIDSQNPKILGESARAYLGANRYLDADKRIREAMAKDPNDANLIYISGLVADSIGKMDEAGKEYERALAKKADLASALAATGQLALAANDKPKAIARAEAAEKAPTAEKTALDQERIAELWLALDEPAKAKVDAAAAQALDPEDPYADFDMGRALAGVGDLAGARPLYEKALARVDGDPAMHFEYGSLLRRQGDLAGARKELEKSVALDAKVSRFYARLGAVLVEQGQAEAAEVQLRQAILMNEHSGEGLYFLGRSLTMQKKLSDAVDVLKKSIEADPSQAIYNYYLGLAYEAGAQLNDAADSFSKSLEKDPKNVDAWEHLGLAYLAQNLFQDALAAFKKGAALDPQNARLWAEIGDAQQQAGDVDHAIENFEKSVKLNDAQAPVWTKLGMAFRERGCNSCTNRAIDALLHATKLAPRDPLAFHELGYVYKDNRKRNDALVAFKKYLELKPDAQDADSVKDDIFYLQQEEGKR